MEPRHFAVACGVKPGHFRRYSAPPGYVPRLHTLRRAREPKLGPLVPIIDAIREADKRPRIERGFAGGSTVAKDYVGLTRTGSREVFVPFAHPPARLRQGRGLRSRRRGRCFASLTG